MAPASDSLRSWALQFPHELRKQQLLSLIQSDTLDDEEALAALYEWGVFWARPNQLAPGGDWSTWMIMAGRGFGKTRTGVEWVRERIETGRSRRMAIIAADAKDARDVIVEGESGLKAICPPWFKPDYTPSLRRLTFPNGAEAFLYSAEDPEELRGPQFDAAFCDEFGKWRYQRETWDQLQFGLRLGDDPRVAIATTPRPTPLMKEVVLDPTTIVTTGTTFDNEENLAPKFLRRVRTQYEGTRIGRQELAGELLDDTPGALFTLARFDATRIALNLDLDITADTIERAKIKRVLASLPCDLARIVVGVDPPASATRESDEAGIIVAGVGIDGRGYLLEDSSQQGSPDQWGSAAVRAFDRWGADRIVAEANQGGDMVAFTIATCAKALFIAGERATDFVPIEMVWASRGKVIRAEPVAALYEQKRISHVGAFAKLEDQAREFTSDFDRDKAGYSPDRLDAKVWAFTQLMLDGAAHDGLADFARQENAALAAKLNPKPVSADDFVELIAPPGINQANGITGALYAVNAAGRIFATPVDAKAFLLAGFKPVVS